MIFHKFNNYDNNLNHLRDDSVQKSNQMIHLKDATLKKKFFNFKNLSICSKFYLDDFNYNMLTY